MFLKSKGPKILVIMHIYYEDMCEELLSKLSNIKEYDFDLIATCHYFSPKLKNQIRAFKEDTTFIEVENVGYDLWPFFKALQSVDLDDYKYLIKIHTKRDITGDTAIIDNRFFFRGSKWREYLLSFMASKKAFDSCMSAFESDDTLGMVNNYRLFDTTREDSHDPHQKQCFDRAKMLIEKCGLLPTPSDKITYVAGTMFMVKAELFKPLLNLNLIASDFSKADRSNENDFAHALERFLGWCVSSQKHNIGSPFTDAKDYIKNLPHSLWCRFITIPIRYRFLHKIIRFVYRKDVKGGYVLYRVFKVTVTKEKLNRKKSKTWE